MYLNKIIFTIMALTVASLAYASDLTFVWDANLEADLEGYHLYQSRVSPVPIESNNRVATMPVGMETTKLSGILDGTYYWALTAYDESGNESEPSNEVTLSLDTPPGKPRGFDVVVTVRIRVIAP